MLWSRTEILPFFLAKKKYFHTRHKLDCFVFCLFVFVAVFFFFLFLFLFLSIGRGLNRADVPLSTCSLWDLCTLLWQPHTTHEEHFIFFHLSAFHEFLTNTNCQNWMNMRTNWSCSQASRSCWLRNVTCAQTVRRGHVDRQSCWSWTCPGYMTGFDLDSCCSSKHLGDCKICRICRFCGHGIVQKAVSMVCHASAIQRKFEFAAEFALKNTQWAGR